MKTEYFPDYEEIKKQMSFYEVICFLLCYVYFTNH